MSGRFDPKSLLHDLPARILSVAAAFSLFFFNRLANVTPRVLSVPLTLTLPAELTPAEPYPKRVRLFIRGPRDLVEDLSEEDFEVIAEAGENRGEGLYTFSLRVLPASDTSLPQGVEINLEPSELRLSLERLVSRVVEVSVPTVGSVASGFQLDAILVSPPSITVRGPRSRVQALRGVVTENLELSGRTETFTARLRLLSPDSLIEFASGTLVEVRVAVSPIIEEAEIADLPVTFENLASGLKLKSEPVLARIRISGPQTLIQLTGPQTLSPSVNLENITRAGLYRLPIRWNLDPRLRILEQEPTTVLVELEEQ